MEAIPVPVHFDGHNINIITKDSPSTCKNRVKFMNSNGTKKKNKKRNGQSCKYAMPQILNKRDAVNVNPRGSLVSNHRSSNKGNIDEPNQIAHRGISPNHTHTLHKACSVPTSIDNTVFPSSTKVSTNMCNQPSRNAGNSALKQGASPRLGAPPQSNIIPATQQFHKQQAMVDLNAVNSQPIVMNRPEHLGVPPPEKMEAMLGDGALENDNGAQGKDHQNLHKTELCREWITSGWCYYNKRCSFAHGLQELRPVFRSKKWRTKRCRNWHTTGYCPYEHRCQFLHDQSPPIRTQDNAKVNARALVAAQQRMQPLYFHYKVVCNPDDCPGEDDEDSRSRKSKESNQPRTTPNPPKQHNDISSNPPLVPPRLKCKTSNNSNQKENHSRVGHNNSNKSKESPRESNDATAKSKTKKKVKDAVITPLNHVKPAYSPGPSQTLGLYNQTATLMMPTPIPSNAAAITGFYGGLPLCSLPATPATPAAGYQSLPPAIDPSLYLALTPSPPHSPISHGQEIAMMSLQTGKQPTDLIASMPVSLTPSPPVLPVGHTQMTKAQGNMDELHSKADFTDTNRKVTELLHRTLMNKSATSVATIDGDMLESLLPTENVEDTKNKSPSTTATSSTTGAKQKSNKNSKPNKPTLKKSTKNVPPIPPIPPPLQLQTSINSVVNDCVAAAMSPPGVKGLVAMTPNFTDHIPVASHIALPATSAVPTTAVASASTNAGMTSAVASWVQPTNSSRAAATQMWPSPAFPEICANWVPLPTINPYATQYGAEPAFGVGSYHTAHDVPAAQPAVTYGLQHAVGMQPSISYPFLPFLDLSMSPPTFPNYAQYPQ